MSTFNALWQKLKRSKQYREEFVAAQVKREIPFQIRTLMQQQGLSQEELAERAKLTQGVVSRAANPNYGNLTLNTLIRLAAGFDMAFVGRFVPFSELAKLFIDLSEESIRVENFNEEDKRLVEDESHKISADAQANAWLAVYAASAKKIIHNYLIYQMTSLLSGQGQVHEIQGRVKAGSVVTAPQSIPTGADEAHKRMHLVPSKPKPGSENYANGNPSTSGANPPLAA